MGSYGPGGSIVGDAMRNRQRRGLCWVKIGLMIGDLVPRPSWGERGQETVDVTVEEESHTEIISHHIPKVKIFIHFLDV